MKNHLSSPVNRVAQGLASKHVCLKLIVKRVICIIHQSIDKLLVNNMSNKRPPILEDY